MVGMFLLFIGLFESVLIILDEKKDKVFDRYQLYNVTNSDIFLSKIVSIFLMLLIIIFLFFVSASIIFKISIANPMAFYTICSMYTFMIATLAVMFSILLKHSNHVQTILLPTILIFSLLGGFWIPLENLSESLNKIPLFLPTGSFMSAGLYAANNIQQDPNFVLSIMVLSGYCVIFIAISLKKIDFIKKKE